MVRVAVKLVLGQAVAEIVELLEQAQAQAVQLASSGQVLAAL